MLNLDTRRAVDQLIEPFGDLILLDQDCFRREEGWKELLQLIPDSQIAETLEKSWRQLDNRSSDDKWSDLKDQIKASYKPQARVSSIRLVLTCLINVIVCLRCL
jgi:DNA primase small subunit